MPKRISISSLEEVHQDVIACRACPRLVQWREEVAKTKVARFSEWDYWGKPVPGFGDPRARLLIVGLAPAAHGANRTGRMFTGDRSGEWLYRTLYKFGFATREESLSRDDSLKLVGCYITAAARCAPPQNKLLPSELAACRPYLLRELEILHNVRVVVALGKIASDALFEALRQLGQTALPRRPQFGHNREYPLNERQILITSFHPSQQNTFTGKLTEAMFDRVFRRAKALLAKYNDV